jgi:NADPH-dependent 2,4-dienoyl-CoA reductase/sulfur reductase-like enzyme/nitrite reductase/ring-hydroxylating ferredoxin subunit
VTRGAARSTRDRAARLSAWVTLATMGGETKLTGPDLGQGIAAADVPEGGSLLGHAQGEAVLLVRRGEEIVAIGATCTHYGGPLSEGLVAGDTIRCPWHHACFSLRTGEALRAPALNALPCFDVQRDGGQIIVLGRREPLTAKRAAAGPSSVVVVGAGAAGNACVETLRSQGYAGPIALLGAEGTTPIDRPNLSKDYLAGNASEEWMSIRGEDFYREHDVDFSTSGRVEKLDLAGKRVLLEGGAARPYGALVLATGAQPNRLAVPGADAPHVFTLRTMADSRGIIAKATGAKRAVVIGASFIGLEVAASLRARGVEVDVVAPETVPLARVLGDAIGAMVKKVHEEHGVRFHLGTSPSAIEAGSVVLANGSRLPADLVVAGVGVKPDLSLAQQAGLTIDRGVVVDDQLRTSAPGVWAVGDVARWPDPRSGDRIRVEHWVVAGRMGQIAAKNVLGAAVRCDIVPFFWSAHFDLVVNYVGHAEGWDRIDVAGSIEGRDAAVAYRKGGKTLAVATIGRDRAALEAGLSMENGDERALSKLVPPS